MNSEPDTADEQEPPPPDTEKEPDTAPEQAPPPRRRRKVSASLHDLPRWPADEWMLTYMDTVTLLVTLFVMLLSFSTIDREKFDAVIKGLNLEKYGTGVMTGSFTLVDIAPEITEEAPRPEDIAAGLQDELAEQGLTDLVDVKVRENVVDFQLNESVLFVSGQADLIAKGLSVVARLVPVLVKLDAAISVEGHTDNVPISTERFPSNWELSAARAASVTRKLIGDGIGEKRVHIRGYAATRPVADNDTAEGRQQNRRVNLILQLSDKPEQD